MKTLLIWEDNLKDWLKNENRIQYSSLKLWFTYTPWFINWTSRNWKSLTAKAIASDWQLLLLDVGKLLVGSVNLITPSSND
jgi:hypothetical protein